MKNKRITRHQLFSLTGLSTLGGSILVISSGVASAAGRDAWLSGIVTMLAGLVMMYVYCYLGTRYDGVTLIGLLQKLFGTWLGKLLSLIYILFFFITAYGVPWYIGSFGSAVMPEVPVTATISLFTVSIIVGVYYGIESVARATEVFIKVFTILFILSMLLVLPNIKPGYLLPVMEDGITPVLSGSVILSVFISIQNITLLMIYPIAVKDKKEGRKGFVRGFLWANSMVIINLLMAILVLGEGIVASSSFATILLTREINIMPILTRIEYVISIIWTLSQFAIGFLYFYSTIMSVSEVLRLKDHRRIILPLGLIVFILSFTVLPEAVEHSSWILEAYTPLTIFVGFILPLIMLAVYLIRRAAGRAGRPDK